MHKLVIPAILVSTILVAGVFAFMPVQQATAVHQQIIDALLAGDFATASFLLNQLGNSHSNISGDIQNTHDWITFQHFHMANQHSNISGFHDNTSGQNKDTFDLICRELLSGTPGFPNGNFVCGPGT